MFQIKSEMNANKLYKVTCVKSSVRELQMATAVRYVVMLWYVNLANAAQCLKLHCLRVDTFNEWATLLIWKWMFTGVLISTNAETYTAEPSTRMRIWIWQKGAYAFPCLCAQFWCIYTELYPSRPWCCVQKHCAFRWADSSSGGCHRSDSWKRKADTDTAKAADCG